MVAVLEMGKSTWMLNAIVPGMERRPLKKAASQQGWAAVTVAQLAR